MNREESILWLLMNQSFFLLLAGVHGLAGAYSGRAFCCSPSMWLNPNRLWPRAIMAVRRAGQCLIPPLTPPWSRIAKHSWD